MLDRFEAIATFAAVADEGGFSAASRTLSVPLATVSRRVSDLEQHLGAQLFVRTTRRVTLTEIGEQFLLTCRRVLDELHEGERLASGEYRAPRGGIVMSAPVGLGSAYLTPIIVDFLAAYPDIDVDLRLSDGVVNLGEAGVDIALRAAHLPDSSLMAIRLGSIRHVVCAAPAYLAQKGVPQSPSDLQSHSCVTFSPLGTSREWLFKTGAKTVRVPVHTRLTVSAAEAAVRAAISGVGVTRLLCYQAAVPIAEKRLAILLRDHEPDPIPISLVYPSGRLVPQKLRALIDFVTPRMKAKLVFEP
jgi:DNA-binding transcriptional LysR family regulator